MRIDEKEANYRIEGRDFNCSIDVTMFFVGGRWKMVLLWYLMSESRSFEELKKIIPNINNKMLSIQLQSLEADSFIVLEKLEGVEEEKYQLTDKGYTLIPMLRELASWGEMMAEKHGELIYLED